MTMHPLNTPAIRWLRRSQWATQKLSRWIEAIQSGLFMGLVDDETFQPFDTFPFDESKTLDVRDEAARGLEPWERHVARQHLADVKSILVVAAGGVRELVGFHELGFETTGVEYGRQLCEASQRELTRRECSATIQWSERLAVPHGAEPFDAAFVARKFLSHVHDRRRRIELLTNIRDTLRPGATLVVACYIRPRDTLAFRMQAALANMLRKLRGRRGCPVEVGDHLDPDTPLYHHHFVWQELSDELREAGFSTVEHETTWFGWAVAQAASADDQHSDSSSDCRETNEQSRKLIETV